MLWNTLDAGYTKAFSRYPDQYAQGLIEFFDSVPIDPQDNEL